MPLFVTLTSQNSTIGAMLPEYIPTRPRPTHVRAPTTTVSPFSRVCPRVFCPRLHYRLLTLCPAAY